MALPLRVEASVLKDIVILAFMGLPRMVVSCHTCSFCSASGSSLAAMVGFGVLHAVMQKMHMSAHDMMVIFFSIVLITF